VTAGVNETGSKFANVDNGADGQFSAVVNDTASALELRKFMRISEKKSRNCVQSKFL
jgi:hypothetical protein